MASHEKNTFYQWLQALAGLDGVRTDKLIRTFRSKYPLVRESTIHGWIDQQKGQVTRENGKLTIVKDALLMTITNNRQPTLKPDHGVRTATRHKHSRGAGHAHKNEDRR